MKKRPGVLSDKQTAVIIIIIINKGNSSVCYHAEVKKSCIKIGYPNHITSNNLLLLFCVFNMLQANQMLHLMLSSWCLVCDCNNQRVERTLACQEHQPQW